MSLQNNHNEGNLNAFFQTSLELFRNVKQKHEEEIVEKLEEFFFSEEYCRRQMLKILQLERERYLRNLKFT